MSRTSLGQRNDRLKKQEVSSLRQVGSSVKPNLEEKYQQPTLNFQEQIDTFLFMKDKYSRIEKETQYMNWEIGQSYVSIKDDFGICVFLNGDRYIGEWKNKNMEGMGIYIFQSEDPITKVIYLGDFQNGRFHGIGKLARFVESQGQMIYYGSWLEGKKTHIGTHYYSPNSYYFGYWVNDMKQGEGKLIFDKGQFVGNWENNYRHGFGKLRIVGKGFTQVYQGNWEADDLPSGKVVYFDQNNTEIGRYEGTFRNGKKQGRGSYCWRGASYEGQFNNDCIEGVGTFKIGKTSFRGTFNSQFNIQLSPQMKGMISYQNGDQFEGIVSIRDGKIMRLRGMYKFAGGDSAQGEFKDNSRGELSGHYLYVWSNGQSKQFD